MTTRDPNRCPTHPGVFLRDMVLPEVSLPKTKIAAALRLSRQQLYEILNGRQSLTPETAVRLEALFGRSADAWLAMQAAHDVWHARRAVDTSGLPPLADAG
jgi:addiction module HigA family antidote